MNKIDLTPIIQALISLLAIIITAKVIPYIKSKTSANTIEILNTSAKIAVGAAEQIYNHGENRSKLNYAICYVMDLLSKEGFQLDIDTIKAAVEKEVNQLKTHQLVGLTEENDLPPLEEWSLDMIKSFCSMNDIPCNDCQTKEDYINAIVNGSVTE